MAASQEGQRSTADEGRLTEDLTPAERITRSILAILARVTEEAGAVAVIVNADSIPARRLPLPEDLRPKLYCVTKTQQQDEAQEEAGRLTIRVPNVSLSRLGQIKVAVLLALSRRLIAPDDVVVCLTGPAGSGTLDTLTVMRVGDEFGDLFDPMHRDALDGEIRPEVLERVITIAAELGSEGREGRPVGGIFVIGDAEHVGPLTRQMILNPFRGYPEDDRNILDPRVEETVKELAVIDGAFIIRGDGVIESAGTYIKAAMQAEAELPSGLGTRHQAAAAITNLTDCVAVTLSESTGTVSVFRHGRIVTELEKPRSQAELRVLP
jgi:diadenylate cyclase